MCSLLKSYKIPRVCVLLIGLGIFVFLLGIAHVAEAEDQTSNADQPLGQLDCGGCHSVTESVESRAQSLVPNLDDIDSCDVCHTTSRFENKEDAHDQQNTENELYHAMTDIIAFKSENPYFAEDSRLDAIVEDLNLAQDYLRQGDSVSATSLIESANRSLDRLRIEAQRTTFVDGSGRAPSRLVAAAQTDTKSRSINEILLSGQSRPLLDTDHQEFIVALKQQVGFTVRTEQVVLYRRVPLSDEEVNVFFHVVSFRQRLPSSNVQSLFYFTGRLNSDGLNTMNTPIQIQPQSLSV